MAAMPTGCSWTFDAQAFLNANLQERKFTDFHQVESQNWLMLGGARAAGRGLLHLHGMFSFEPFTLRKLGSAEVFQTGETYHGAFLKNYQHPHNLVMGADAWFEWPASGETRANVDAALVGAPALGPRAAQPAGQVRPTIFRAHLSEVSTRGRNDQRPAS